MLTLTEILCEKLIPWSQENAEERLIVVQDAMLQNELPYGIHLEKGSLKPPRRIVKNKRCYNNVRNVLAEWPAENLQELGKSTLVCILDGHVNYPLGNYRIQCGKGYFIFIPAGIPMPDMSCIYTDLRKSPFCEVITFLQHPSALECWTSHNDAETKTRSNNYLFTHHHLNDIFNVLMQEILTYHPRSPNTIGLGLLHIFFCMLQREIEEKRFQYMRSRNIEYPRKVQGPAVPLSGFGTRLKAYIHANLRQPLTLEKAAQEFYLSPAQFTRNVRSVTGQSFNRLLVQARLEEAKSLLKNTDWAIFSIAELTGFRSTSYFCSFFREQTGQTPSEFRAAAIRRDNKD